MLVIHLAVLHRCFFRYAGSPGAVAKGYRGRLYTQLVPQPGIEERLVGAGTTLNNERLHPMQVKVVHELWQRTVVGQHKTLGVRSLPMADGQLLEMARVFRMGSWRKLRYVYLPALLDIIQFFVEESFTNSATNIFGLSYYNGNLSKARKQKIYIARDDLDADFPERDSIAVISPGIIATDNFAADSLFDAGCPEALIAFSISPAEPSRSARCFNFIVAADTHDLYYYQSRRYNKPGKRGFSKSAIKSIRREHGYKDEKRKK